ESKVPVRGEKVMKTAQQKPKPPQQRPRPRHWALPVLLLLLAGGGSWATFELVVWNKLPADLVGKWVVEGGPQDGAAFDFARNGTMVGRINIKGREGIISAKVHVEGDKLLTSTRNPHTGNDETRTQTIKTLTSDTLVLEDARGATLHLARAKNTRD